MNSTQKPFQSALLPQKSPFSHWALLRAQLIWAYDRDLEGTPRTWAYLSYPTPAWLIESGEVTLHFPEGSEHYSSGTWVFPREGHGQQEFARDTRILSLRFIAEWPTGKPLFRRQQSYSFHREELPAFTQASRTLCTYVEQHFPGSYHPPHLSGSLEQYFQLQPHLYHWLTEYYQTLSSRGIAPTTLSQLHEKVQQTLQFLETLPVTQPLHENALAKRIGLSLSQFNKIFLKDIGSTPAHYWNERRLRAARTQLAANKESIKTLAYEFGFSSPANFTRWFRTNCGITPTAFRQLNSQAPMV